MLSGRDVETWPPGKTTTHPVPLLPPSNIFSSQLPSLVEIVCETVSRQIYKCRIVLNNGDVLDAWEEEFIR